MRYGEIEIQSINNFTAIQITQGLNNIFISEFDFKEIERAIKRIRKRKISMCTIDEAIDQYEDVEG